MTAFPETRVVLVEDHPTFRLGLRSRLELEPDLVVVGEAGTGAEALEHIVELRPDVAVVDLNLPDIGGIDLIDRLRRHAPGVRVLVLTMLDDASVRGAVHAGASGYLLKDAEPSQIVAAIRTVAAGDVVFSGSVRDRVLFGGATGATPGPFSDLNARETEVLALVARGLGNAEIARRLYLSPKTVRNYVSTILGKLGASNRHDAIIRARRAGLGDDDSRQ